jgi:energy-coupling factor transport system permease protein
VYITALFLLGNIISYIFAAVCLSTAIFLSKIPVKFMFKGLRMIFAIILFTTFLNVFFTPGEHVLMTFWRFTVTQEGLVTAAAMSARLVMIIVGASILTLATSPLDLTDAMESLMKPLSKIGVPAHEIAMMTSIALRFIPTLAEEMEKIMKAQIARGADFDSGGLIKKAKGLAPLLAPLFISAFRRADELAAAMEARCYRGGEGRTKMNVMKLKKIDINASIIVAMFVFGIVILNFIKL